MSSHDHYTPEAELEKYIGESTASSSDTADTKLFTKQEGFERNYKLVQIKIIQRMSELGWLKSKDLDEAAEEFSLRFAPSFAEHINQDTELQKLITNLHKNPKNMNHIVSIVIQFINKRRLIVRPDKIFKKRPK